MNQREIKKADVAELVQAYIAAAVAHGRASAEGDYNTANPRAKELIAIYQELRARGPDAQGALVPLLDSDDPKVRLSAAAHALEFAPDRAERVLEQIASGPQSLEELSARMALREWRGGRLRFP